MISIVFYNGCLKHPILRAHVRLRQDLCQLLDCREDFKAWLKLIGEKQEVPRPVPGMSWAVYSYQAIDYYGSFVPFS